MDHLICVRLYSTFMTSYKMQGNQVICHLLQLHPLYYLLLSCSLQLSNFKLVNVECITKEAKLDETYNKTNEASRFICLFTERIIYCCSNSYLCVHFYINACCCSYLIG